MPKRECTTPGPAGDSGGKRGAGLGETDARSALAVSFRVEGLFVVGLAFVSRGCFGADWLLDAWLELGEADFLVHAGEPTSVAHAISAPQYRARAPMTSEFSNLERRQAG